MEPTCNRGEVMKKMPDKRALSQKEIDAAFNSAKELLKNEAGEISESPYDYQCFTYKSQDVCLVFYPHRTSARNYHIRVRNQGSKNKEKAEKLMKMLDEGSGYNRIFSKKINIKQSKHGTNV